MLRRVACVLCCVLCAGLVLCAGHVAGHLPVPQAGLTALPYQGWSGVVRVWLYQGFRSGTGSIVPWLSECLSAYERRNQGVYVHVETVTAQEMGQAAQAGLPPDVLIFTPGTLPDAAGLAPLDAPQELMASVSDACMWNGAQCALPLCRGGYGMLLNTELMSGLPDDWTEAVERLYAAPARRQSARYALQVPGEGAWADAARRMLGALPGSSDKLPGDYMQCTMQKAWSDFSRGTAACIPAGQWHLRQLELLEAKGEGMEYAFIPETGGTNDQYFAAAIVQSRRSDAAGRMDECARILEHLVGAESQAALTAVRLFPVRSDMTLYARGDMERLERACASADYAPLFGGE